MQFSIMRRLEKFAPPTGIKVIRPWKPISIKLNNYYFIVRIGVASTIQSFIFLFSNQLQGCSIPENHLGPSTGTKLYLRAIVELLPECR